MKIIKRDEKDTFDIITHKLTYLENERFNLLVSMLAIVQTIESYRDSFKYTDGYINSLNSFTKEQIDENNREAVLYEKMLRYLQLMITNDTYEYYTDSYYYDLFTKVIELLEISKYHRNAKRTAFYYSLQLGIAYSAEQVTIASMNDAVDTVLTDEIYNDILKKIPKR